MDDERTPPPYPAAVGTALVRLTVPLAVGALYWATWPLWRPLLAAYRWTR